MKSLMFIFIMFVMVAQVSARIITVDNVLPSCAEYSQFSTAYNSAVDGDTIYVYPTGTSYGYHNLYKRLTIIGAGFGLESNLLSGSKISLSPQNGSTGSRISGVIMIDSFLMRPNDVIFSNCNFAHEAYIEVVGSGNTFSECLFNGELFNGNGSEQSVNNLFTRCKFVKQGYGNLRLRTYSSAYFSNCSFRPGINNHIIRYDGISEATFMNCLFHGQYPYFDGLIWGGEGDDYHFVNCIFIDLGDFQRSATFQYNLLSNTFGYVDPTNQQNVNMAQVLVDYANEDYHLIPGSLAIGAGIDGSTVGNYGGATPFNDNYFLTVLPTITDFDCPQSPNAENQLNIHIRAESGN